MGMRLPLDTLPASPPTLADPVIETDPFDVGPPLGLGLSTDGTGTGASRTGTEAASTVAPAAVADPVVVRTALTFEARDGVVRAFLPPLESVEHGLELVAAIESAARACEVPILVEGYPLPVDPRVKRLSVTPDPGVIEVNVQPTSTFDELLALTTGLYTDAHQVGLATEKFHLDGRHTGTGGGNHVTLGGPTPADSPLLRNPALLPSIVTYWQHHPSLSYLFSGLFVGPTSQAPRIDEARHENLHEMEIALGQLDQATNTNPWLVDRALRHLLVDLTGNTHRAELCIDKLYSPEHARGRLGLLELRAFEMPPHARMAMVQFLMIRAIIARLWSEPYRKPLIRWGTDLHDRFLLPHYLAEDARDVIDDLGRAGFDFEPGWLEPFFEFRFPRYGTVVVGNVSLELRAAIEPWLVLGEEAMQGGTSRFVDSSLERLQVKASGLVAGRHVVAVNGRRIPLRPTGRSGEHVAGVRYRAWHPASALHPTIGVHHPLSFTIIDTWSDEVIGGARYHVSHPGGLAYDTFPVNALEAETRRQSRFDDWTQATQAQPPDVYARSVVDRLPRPAITNARLEPITGTDSLTAISDSGTDRDFPLTLDLRI
jgi:uncharacterized protein (DUF2126 family)